jgi:hypothetical protein
VLPANLKNVSRNFDKKPADPVSRYPKNAAFTDIFVVFAHLRFSYLSRYSPNSFMFASRSVTFSQFTLYSQTFDARLYADHFFHKRDKEREKRTCASILVKLSFHGKLHKNI